MTLINRFVMALSKLHFPLNFKIICSDWVFAHVAYVMWFPTSQHYYLYLNNENHHIYSCLSFIFFLQIIIRLSLRAIGNGTNTMEELFKSPHSSRLVFVQIFRTIEIISSGIHHRVRWCRVCMCMCRVNIMIKYILQIQ